MQTQSELEV